MCIWYFRDSVFWQSTKNKKSESTVMWVKWCWKCCQTTSQHIQVTWSFFVDFFFATQLNTCPCHTQVTLSLHHHILFPSSQTRSFSSFPSSWWVVICDMLCFQAHQPASLSSSPPASESSFVTCHVSKLTNLLLPLPPLQFVSPHLWCAMFPSSLTCSSLFLPFRM